MYKHLQVGHISNELKIIIYRKDSINVDATIVTIFTMLKIFIIHNSDLLDCNTDQNIANISYQT